MENENSILDDDDPTTSLPIEDKIYTKDGRRILPIKTLNLLKRTYPLERHKIHFHFEFL